MSDPNPSRPRPNPLSRMPAQPGGAKNSLTGLLANRSAHSGSTPIPPGLQAKMAAMANRASQAPPSSSASFSVDKASDAMARASLADHPANPRAQSYPIPTLASRGRGGPTGLAGKRMKPGFKLSDIHGDVGGGAAGAGLGAGRPSLANDPAPRRPPPSMGSPFSNFGKIVDPSGALNFSGKAVLHASGVDFSNGSSFAINMEQLQLDEELGKGNYGTVKKVLHRPTNVAMAMKEIRLELDEAKLNAIIMELDILHRAVHPEIVEFYGAFFIESCVYYCMEYMDAGSLDKLQGCGVPEDVLARIAGCMVRGLKFLKDDLQIIHRDVKPTNVLVNRKGAIKLCDFGVSGQLEKSLAKTNIGCQSYMAPERIKGESQNNLGTYTVSSDVWSLGLSMIEIGMGRYPYPPETYSNVFAQLTAIVHGDPPTLPGRIAVIEREGGGDGVTEVVATETAGLGGPKENTYSEDARDWVSKCLIKEPDGRATYAELLVHPFLNGEAGRDVDMVGWVERALAHRAAVKAAAESASSPPSASATLSPAPGSV
ncbi:kinase-like protein [Athelia psychrophila]|uniref:mitogen-activated protein kinase kinase n=1 Tax=Athelia psychrophila TaxID=1759441 RepID=A0A166HDY0_9AGAM|nr:kinase-like protein [Fibularhizoctonia sp. CBS 109695]